MPIIETRDLTKHYGRTIGLEGLDLRVEQGEVFGFLGPNGSGKTTTIRLLLDLIRPTRGMARLFGREVADATLRRRVGYLPGELALDPRLSGRRLLEFLDGLQPGGGAVRATRVVLRVSGELDALIAVLARHPVLDLSFPESSLEEAFVDLYRADGVRT